MFHYVGIAYSKNAYLCLYGFHFSLICSCSCSFQWHIWKLKMFILRNILGLFFRRYFQSFNFFFQKLDLHIESKKIRLNSCGHLNDHQHLKDIELVFLGPSTDYLPIRSCCCWIDILYTGSLAPDSGGGGGRGVVSIDYGLAKCDIVPELTLSLFLTSNMHANFRRWHILDRSLTSLTGDKLFSEDDWVKRARISTSPPPSVSNAMCALLRGMDGGGWWMCDRRATKPHRKKERKISQSIVCFVKVRRFSMILSFC